MRLTEAFGRINAFLILPVLLHLRFAKACIIKVALQGRSLQHTFRNFVLTLKNIDNLIDGPGRNFFLQNDGFLDKILKIFRQKFCGISFSCLRFQTRKALLAEGTFIAADSTH